MYKRQLLEQLKGKENVTKSGQKVNVYANIGNLSDVGAVLQNDAGGIGLFRSEDVYKRQVIAGKGGDLQWNFFPAYPTLRHYVKVLLDSPQFWTLFWNSVKLTSVTVLGQILSLIHILVMLVSALAGREHVLAAYEEAVKERYRLFSFGDAMLIQ